MNIKQFAREIFRQVKRDWYLPVTEHQIYDTTERVIGSYMGKPLYRKVITGNATANSTTLAKIGSKAALLPNVETILHAGGTLDVVYGGISYPALLIIRFSNDDFQIGQEITSGMLTFNYVAILEYTKTTDTATTSKVPFEPLTEYSTEERMIGYWIDGKPLYRKTVICSALTNNGRTTVPHGITDIAEITNMTGGYWRGNNAQFIPIHISDTPLGQYQLRSSVEGGNIIIDASGDYSTATRGQVTLEYTKTTD